MRALLLLLTALGICACDAKNEGPTTSAPPIDTIPDKPPEIEAAPAIPEAEVRAVFDTWLSAQNSGDFEQYSKQYAERFEGIKRVGPRQYRYDHDGWLKDRQRMFQKQMVVTTNDVQLHASATSASIAFVQTWSSGDYKDTGPKQLLLAKHDDGLRIVREEMLASYVGEPGEAPTYDPAQFALLVDGALVLDINPRREWADGSAELIARPTTARRNVSEDTGYAAWVGRDVELFGAHGKVCDAKVSSIELRARVTPHFATVAHWNGEDGSPKLSDAQVAAEIWALAAGSVFRGGVDLVGVLDGERCNGALWAHAKDAASAPLPKQQPEGPAARKLVDAYTDLPGYHTTQADYAKDAHAGAWHLADDARTHFTKFGPWWAASATAGSGCGAFEGAFSGIWKNTDGKLVLQTDEESGMFFAPQAAATVGSATYFIEPDRVLSEVGGVWRVVFETKVLDLDCGC